MRPLEVFSAFTLTLTFAWIAGIFSLSTAPIQDLWRPLVLGLLGAGVWAAAVTVIARGNRLLVVLASMAWLMALGAWPVVAAIGVILAWRGAISLLRRARRKAPLEESAGHQAGRIANALGAALAIVAIVSVAMSEAISLEDPSSPASRPAPGTPNMYFLLLDGYPRADTLVSDFNFGNEWLIDELSERGFEIAAQSRSNYNSTLLTLSSMLHMAYVDSIESLHPPPSDPIRQARRLTAAINQAPATQRLRDAGYQIVSIRSLYGQAALASADEVRWSASLTHFEGILVRSSTVGRLVLSVNPEIVADQYRRDILATFDQLEDVARHPRADPTMVLAHSFGPHAPMLFNADGSPRSAPACYPADCSLTTTQREALGKSVEAYGEALTGYLEFLNRRIVQAVDAIVESDSEAVIVLFSDHGARHEAGIADEHFRILFAARTPNEDGLFPNDVSLVNVFRLLFNAYLGDDHDPLDYRAWWADPARPLELNRID